MSARNLLVAAVIVSLSMIQPVEVSAGGAKAVDQGVGSPSESYLVRVSPKSGRLQRCQYQPEEGDIVIFRGWRLLQRPVRSILQRPVQKMATWSNQLHVGIIVCDDQGRLRLLEADRNKGVQLHSPLSYMYNWQLYYGEVWVRRRQEPLTGEQSRALTEFALNHQGEEYAPLWEVANYIFSAPLVEELPALTEPFDRGSESQRWFCSKLVVEAIRSAGLISPLASGAGSAPKHLAKETFCLYPDWDQIYQWQGQ